MLYKPSSIGNRGMSVDLKNLIEQNGIDAKTFVSNPKFTGSILLNVGKLRELSFQVGYDPLPENPYHGEVWGTFSKANQKKISRLAQWFVEIPDVSLVI